MKLGNPAVEAFCRQQCNQNIGGKCLVKSYSPCECPIEEFVAYLKEV